MTAPGGGAQEDRREATRRAAAIVIAALAVSWLLLTVLDLRKDDGAAPMIALFGIPAVASALVIQILMTRMGKRKRVPRPVLWWMLAVLPLGTLLGFVVALLRDPEYFIADDGPWMLVWVPIFIGVGIMLGLVVWFFFVFPTVTLVRVIGQISRKEARPTALIMPLVLLALGIACVIGGLSISTGGIGRRAEAQIIAAFFGIPGTYDVVWAPGLWIVRGIVAGIVILFAVPLVSEKRKHRAPAVSS
nr:hypothetical protein [uncultured Microbacterium sp.]